MERILVGIIIILLVIILNLAYKIKIYREYNSFSQRNINHYKEWLYNIARDTNDLKLYDEVQKFSENARKEFLNILGGNND